MTRSKRFMDMSRPRSQQQSSSSTHEQFLSDAPLEEKCYSIYSLKKRFQENIIIEMDQDSSSQSQSVSQDDPLGKVFGKEHPGRVRGLGFRPCPSKVFNNEMHRSSNDNQMKEYVSNLEKELAATKAQLQAQNDMQKTMGGALVAILEKTFGKVPEEFATCSTKHLNQYQMKEASTNIHKGVD